MMDYNELLKYSCTYFSARKCTPSSIEEFIRLFKVVIEECNIDYEKVYSDLERKHSVTIKGTSIVIEDKGDHIDWFNQDTNVGINRDIDWHFWKDYKNYLSMGKGWPKDVVDSLDYETSSILSRIEDPFREGPWDRRGMVMGSVQSGKTANYTGLIAKAIDAGYKLIVVMAGVHNSLRSQTQFRINEEILGYDLDTVQEFQGQVEGIGVRAMFREHMIAQTLTSSNENGDFSKRIAEQAGIIPTSTGPATILIVKKHVSILKNILQWATQIIGKSDESGNKVVTDIPILLIDDECDYASVDTRKHILDENGVIDEECDPAKTNMRIRQLLCAFRKKAYIGYTATPFANIFIHHKRFHPKYGEDLFPRNFIISLPKPSNYIGPERLFGLQDHQLAGIKASSALPVLRYITDSDDIIPPKHKKDLKLNTLPESLKEAIKIFLISSAVRRIRNSSPSHNSMLIHVTRFTDVQKEVYELVIKELQKYVARIQNRNDNLSDFKKLWENDFKTTRGIMDKEFDCDAHNWQDVMQNLYPVARRIKVKMINGKAKESLDYRYAELGAKQRIEQGENLSWEEMGEHVIAIGGDKLSRGLTLDGLTISYYLRASRMYDTLMQMGRWFGYRDGYEDVCRIYTTRELVEWYRYIATASLELRHELEYMRLIEEEPRNFGLKVLDHPGQLAITSAGKRRNAEQLNLSYSGRISETVVFDLQMCENNLEVASNLLRGLRKSEYASPVDSAIPSDALHWTDVAPAHIIEFLNEYKTDDQAARVVNPKNMAIFIEEQLKHGLNDLSTWDVAFISRKDQKNGNVVIDNSQVGLALRTPLDKSRGRLTIRRLLNRSDEWLDLSSPEKDRAFKLWSELKKRKGEKLPLPSDLPPGPIIRDVRPKERGLLLIYFICNTDGKTQYGLNDKERVCAFAISFPTSKTTKQVTYLVDSVYQDAED